VTSPDKLALTTKPSSREVTNENSPAIDGWVSVPSPNLQILRRPIFEKMPMFTVKQEKCWCLGKSWARFFPSRKPTSCFPESLIFIIKKKVASLIKKNEILPVTPTLI